MPSMIFILVVAPVEIPQMIALLLLCTVLVEIASLRGHHSSKTIFTIDLKKLLDAHTHRYTHTLNNSFYNRSLYKCVRTSVILIQVRGRWKRQNYLCNKKEKESVISTFQWLPSKNQTKHWKSILYNHPTCNGKNHKVIPLFTKKQGLGKYLSRKIILESGTCGSKLIVNHGSPKFLVAETNLCSFNIL